jgi:hypothetical protein
VLLEVKERKGLPQELRELQAHRVHKVLKGPKD